MSACVFALPARADVCSVTETRGALANMSGAHITSVDVVSEGPDLPGALGFFGGFHVASQPSVIRRRLLFAPGDTVDTLLVGESMRRLRAQRLYSDAVIVARQCEPGGGVALLIRTRDTWTFRPTAQIRSSSQLSFGIEERNLFGTGRTLGATREMTTRGNGGAVSLIDPFLLGSDVAGNARIANLAGGHALRLGLRRHEYSVFDNWKIEGNLARLSYEDTIVNERALHTISAMTMVGRRFGGGETNVTMMLAGIEFDSAASISTSRRAVAGSPHVRSFRGIDIGLQRRTAQFDNAEWLVPGKGFLDIPIGWEGEGVVAGGYENDARVPALKLDGWIGRVWVPGRTSILLADGWLSGYYGRGVDQNQITRASVSYFASAPRGMWSLKLMAEQLLELDPDRRGLSLMPAFDYTTPVVRQYAARGGRSMAGSVNRDVRVMHVGAASVLNVGGFMAGSYRWRVDSVPGNTINSGVVGARLRLLSANGAVSSVRVDVGYPVAGSEILARKPFVVVIFGALFDVSRARDGRRVY
ncbi:MAG: hypothetical protein JWM95_5646 [Gemmatimonadetes bacterium]|nr:hypothetical protein [Gemmatimonadota bacterium]